MILLGIDPGVHTGFAVYDPAAKQLIEVATMSAVAAEVRVLAYCCKHESVRLYFEDARKRQWLGSKGREALQGAGSIKRDSQRWEEFCQYHGIDFVAVAPQHNRTKLPADQFQRITGWTGRTNEHGRDAAMLVFGR